MKKYELVIKDLITKIQNNEISGKLPTESELVAEYNVSKNTIRTALFHLINKGYISSRHGSGYFINEMYDTIANNVLSLQSFGSLYKDNDIKTEVLEFTIIKPSNLLINELQIKQQ